jgi:hypothetical protein
MAEDDDVFQLEIPAVKRNKKSDNVKDSSFSNVAIRVARSIRRESLLPVNDDDYDNDDDGSDDDDEAGPRLQADEERAVSHNGTCGAEAFNGYIERAGDLIR